MRTRIRRTCERLESRLCLTVLAEVVNGDLVVEGQAEGDVVITAQGGVHFEIVDGSSTLQVTGVSDDIRVMLDENGSADNKVTLELGGEAIDRVIVDLGDGNNQFEVKGGTVGGSLRYIGGDGDDKLTLASDATVEGSVVANLGAGDNSIDVEGEIARSLSIRARAGEDSLRLGEGARG